MGDDAKGADVEILWSAWTTQLLFLIALAALACLVNRLRVLTAPLLCIVGSVVVSPSLCAELFGRHWLVPVICFFTGSALCFVAFSDGETLDRALTVQEFQSDYDMRELVQCMNQSLSSDSLLMADMTMTAKTRLISPNVHVGNHPQYESKTSRHKNRIYYRTFTCASPETVHSLLVQYNVTHVLLNANACKARIGKLDAFHDKPDQCGKVDAARLQQRSFCWGGWLSSSPGLFELAFRNPIYTILRVGNATKGSARKGRATKDFVDPSTWRPWLAGLKGRAAARAIARSAADWPKKYGGWDVAELMQSRAEELSPKDPIVILQRGQMQALQGDKTAAYKTMSRAAKAAAETKALYRVYQAWKSMLGDQQDIPRVKKLAKALKPQLEASRNAFDLCDLAAWMKEWGEPALASELWKGAKNASRYDECVREEWAKFEGRPLTQMEIRRAFLGL